MLQLHSFDAEHHHGSIADRHDKPYGNGVLLWLRLTDFDGVVQRAAEMDVEIVIPRHRNPPEVTADRITGSAGCEIRTGISWS